MIVRFVERCLVVAGLAAIVVGSVALMFRPESTVHPTADLDVSVVIIPPGVVTLEGLGEIVVIAPDDTDVRTARPVDVYAWSVGIDVGVVRGLDTWEEIQVVRVGTASGEVPPYQSDLWRGRMLVSEEAVIDTSDVESGLMVAVLSGSEAPLERLTFEMTRDRGGGWVWTTLASGLGVLTAGLAVVAARLVRERLGVSGKAAS